jgi:molybdopterin biosynthesis enzyme
MSVPAIFDAPTTENGYSTSEGPVTPEAARRIVLENIDVVSGIETLPLHAAVGRIAAEDLLSAVALPGFDNAAVDGFGIHADDHNLPIPLTLSIVERVVRTCAATRLASFLGKICSWTADHMPV